MTRSSDGSRQLHVSASSIGLVALGGAIGTGARSLLVRAVPLWVGVPVATFAINVVGAFLLGALLERLSAPSLNPDRGRRIRLLAGTGLLGGFTTYSALATDTVTLLGSHPGRAAGYALATVAVGAAGTTAGIWVTRRFGRPLPPVQPAAQ